MTATYSNFSVLDDANVTPDVAAAVSSAKLCKTLGVKSVARLLASILLPVNNTPVKNLYSFSFKIGRKQSHLVNFEWLN